MQATQRRGQHGACWCWCTEGLLSAHDCSCIKLAMYLQALCVLLGGRCSASIHLPLLLIQLVRLHGQAAISRQSHQLPQQLVWSVMVDCQ